MPFDKLHQMGLRIELRIQRQRQQESDNGYQQSNFTRARGLLVASQQHQDTTENWCPDYKTQ